MNIHYIRAAIEQNTGIRLSLLDTKRILIEEGMIKDAEIYPNYNQLDPQSPDFELIDDDPYDLIPDESISNIILAEDDKEIN